MRKYEQTHIVGFEETNLVGNVYYLNYLRWQGRCRELFLREHMPDVLTAMASGMAIVTTKCSCEFFAELVAFDEVMVRMHLGGLTQNRITMHFEYWRRGSSAEELVARGEQQVAFMHREGSHMVAVPIPEPLRLALRSYAEV